MVTLTLDAPGKNALGLALMESVIARLRDAAGEPVLVTGAGDAFSAGLNLKEVAALDRHAGERFLGVLEDMVEALFTYPGPMVAAVNGHAIAGGCVVALAADYRVLASAPQVRIGLNEVALGLEYPPKVFALVRHRVPPRGLERVVLEAGLYDPATALQLGLVDELAADPVAVATARLATLATHPRRAYVETKRTLRAGVLDVSEARRRWFLEELVPAWVTPEVKARVADALRKR